MPRGEDSEIECTGTTSGKESEIKDVVNISTETESTEDEKQAAPVNPRPRRVRNPPLRLTYGLGGEQVELRDLVEDSD